MLFTRWLPSLATSSSGAPEPPTAGGRPFRPRPRPRPPPPLSFPADVAAATSRRMLSTAALYSLSCIGVMMISCAAGSVGGMRLKCGRCARHALCKKPREEGGENPGGKLAEAVWERPQYRPSVRGASRVPSCTVQEAERGTPLLTSTTCFLGTSWVATSDLRRRRMKGASSVLYRSTRAACS